MRCNAIQRIEDTCNTQGASEKNDLRITNSCGLYHTFQLIPSLISLGNFQVCSNWLIQINKLEKLLLVILNATFSLTLNILRGHNQNTPELDICQGESATSIARLTLRANFQIASGPWVTSYLLSGGSFNTILSSYILCDCFCPWSLIKMHIQVIRKHTIGFRSNSLYAKPVWHNLWGYQ